MSKIRYVELRDQANFIRYELMSDRGTAYATVMVEPAQFCPSVEMVMSALALLVPEETLAIKYYRSPMGLYDHTSSLEAEIETWCTHAYLVKH